MGVQKDTIDVIERMANTVSEQVTAAVSANVSQQVFDLKMYVVEEFGRDRERISSLEIIQELRGADIAEMKKSCIATHPRKTSSSMIPKPERTSPFSARVKVWIPAGIGIAIGIGFGIKFLIERGIW